MGVNYHEADVLRERALAVQFALGDAAITDADYARAFAAAPADSFPSSRSWWRDEISLTLRGLTTTVSPTWYGSSTTHEPEIEYARPRIDNYEAWLGQLRRYLSESARALSVVEEGDSKKYVAPLVDPSKATVDSFIDSVRGFGSSIPGALMVAGLLAGALVVAYVVTVSSIARR